MSALGWVPGWACGTWVMASMLPGFFDQFVRHCSALGRGSPKLTGVWPMGAGESEST